MGVHWRGDVHYVQSISVPHLRHLALVCIHFCGSPTFCYCVGCRRHHNCQSTPRPIRYCTGTMPLLTYSSTFLKIKSYDDLVLEFTICTCWVTIRFDRLLPSICTPRNVTYSPWSLLPVNSAYWILTSEYIHCMDCSLQSMKAW